MLIAIRVDASVEIGTGHLRRCLALAQACQSAGSRIVLVTRELDGVSRAVLRNHGVAVTWLQAPASIPQQTVAHREVADVPHRLWARVPWPADVSETVESLRAARPDWLVIDHYAFDARWHRTAREQLGCRLLVLDDTADRDLEADLALDANAAPDPMAKYGDRGRGVARWLAGPRFALLAPAYLGAEQYTFDPRLRSVGIFMGGTDPSAISAQVLAACRRAGLDVPIEVISTSANPHLGDLSRACQRDGRATLTVDEPDLASFFRRHDLQIGAGGGATWERCVIGAPTVALAVASNQVPGLTALARAGAVQLAALDDDAGRMMLKAPALDRVLRRLAGDGPARCALSARARTLVDGRGAQRVALALLGGALEARPATALDAELLHRWRNHPAVRSVSRSPEAIELSQHRRWLDGVLQDEHRWLYIACIGSLDIGSVRFDRRAETDDVEVSIYLDPDLQGLGLGQRALLAAELALARTLQRPLTVHALVLAGNRASRNLFEASGYAGGPEHYAKSIRACVPARQST
jgi:UDP-2,4-diacetamido-2,4,6-trideoxy-beta-L-altropyranose hydrolase